MNRLRELVTDLGWFLEAFRTNDRVRSRLKYLGLKYRYLLEWYAFRREPTQRKIEGHQIHFLEHHTFLLMFGEIFVSQTYKFEARGPKPLIIDAGSNIGMSLLYFKLLHPNARVIAFEPHPTLFDVLTRNVETNHLADVQLHRKALADRLGTVDFFAYPDRPGALTPSLLRSRGGGNRFRVEAVPLSDHISGEVDFLKLDVEGAEHLVLQDLDRTGKLTLIRQAVIEYHHHAEPGEDRLSEILSLLERNGYGYQVHAGLRPPFSPRRFQDLLLYAYRKDAAPNSP
ncbi:MAG: FkbM family methyltransferase [Nitrospirae bacterium]|nr:FkbM family methyltransferase [Nitrospirota bacterium]